MKESVIGLLRPGIVIEEFQIEHKLVHSQLMAQLQLSLLVSIHTSAEQTTKQRLIEIVTLNSNSYGSLARLIHQT